MNVSAHAEGFDLGERFAFGKYGLGILQILDEERILQAERSLKKMLKTESLAGKRFLRVGNGIDLFSLVAWRMRASLRPFDLDPRSVVCAVELKRRYFPDHSDCIVEEAPILDERYVASLGKFDFVYLWGVIHHTGVMRKAIDNAVSLCRPGGTLVMAIYSNMGGGSRRWTCIKQFYCRLRRPFRLPFVLAITAPIQVRFFLIHAVQGKALAYSGHHGVKDRPGHERVARRDRLDRQLSLRGCKGQGGVPASLRAKLGPDEYDHVQRQWDTRVGLAERAHRYRRRLVISPQRFCA